MAGVTAEGGQRAGGQLVGRHEARPNDCFGSQAATYRIAYIPARSMSSPLRGSAFGLTVRGGSTSFDVDDEDIAFSHDFSVFYDKALY